MKTREKNLQVRFKNKMIFSFFKKCDGINGIQFLSAIPFKTQQVRKHVKADGVNVENTLKGKEKSKASFTINHSESNVAKELSEPIRTGSKR